MAPLFCVLVTEAGVTKVWSSTDKSFEAAIQTAKTCATCNPHKTWFAVFYLPGERYAVATEGR